jgi:uncharacterized protein (TIGR03083 family)
MEAFRLEAEQLTQAVVGLSEATWDLPTRCEPWRVRDLLAHVRIVIAWLPSMLTAPSPDGEEVDARAYYRPDTRFAPAANATRIGLAQDHAAVHPRGHTLAEGFATTWREVDLLCRAEPAARVVRSRHGDAMLLSEFMLTRVVELAVHGLDVADALGLEPWLTPEAADAVQELLLGSPEQAGHPRLDRVGWDQARFLRKATGREPIDDAEAAALSSLGIHWLALG